jgi:hypothetical protein
MKKTLLIFASLLISFSLYSQKKSVDSLTKKMTVSKGIINSFIDNNKLFFEIPNGLLNKEILVVTRLAQVPSGYSPYINAGSKTSEQVISFSWFNVWGFLNFLQR